MAETPNNGSGSVNMSANAAPLGFLNGTTANFTDDPLAFLLSHTDVVLLDLQLIASTLAIIFVGAHGALRRPPSAAPARSKKNGKKRESEDQFTEGFQASDAIVLPFVAGLVLTGLYYLIKWLQDPDLLNKIVRGYISVASLMSLGMLAADALHVLTTVVFPAVWSDRRGNVFRIDPSQRCQWRLEGRGEAAKRVRDEKRTSPFPDPIAWIPRLLLKDETWWSLRLLLKEEWTFELAAHGLGRTKFGVTLNGVLGPLVAGCVAVVYFLAPNPLLNNVLGLGLCYGGFMFVSCTSFGIGSGVLAGLFVYDIIMVFYTPYMVTVATTLDAPIKLEFQAPALPAAFRKPGKQRASLLGLGDIVVPGIFICLALRFDLSQYYQRQIKFERLELKSESRGEAAGELISSTTTQKRAVKMDYVSPRGRWGDRLWTWSWGKSVKSTPGLKAAAFPKPYFYAAMAGYLAGILTTLVVLLIFKRGQPALFYLVPGVLIPTWATGYLRGEIKELWKYTEDGTLDTKDVVVEVDADGRIVKEIDTEEEKKKKAEDRDGAKKDGGGKQGEEKIAPAKTKGESGEQGHTVFLFSIRAPGEDEIDDDEL